MGEVLDDFLNKVQMVTYAIKEIDPQTKGEILTKYDMIASALINKTGESVVQDNAVNYSVLLNKNLFMALITTTPALELRDYTNLTNVLRVVVHKNNGDKNTKAYKMMYNQMSNVVGKYSQIHSGVLFKDDIINALNTFGLENAKADDLAGADLTSGVDKQEEIPDAIKDNIEWDAAQEPVSVDAPTNTVDAPIGETSNGTPDDMSLEDTDIDLDDIMVDFGDEDNTTNTEGFEPGDTVENYDNTEDNDELTNDDFSMSMDDLMNDSEKEYDKSKEESKEKEKVEEEKEKAYKKELDAGDVSGKANDLTEADKELNEELEAYVENIISNIMDVYNMLYRPLFLNPPKGVMYTNEKNGAYDIMCVGKSEEKEGVKVHNIPSIRLFISTMYKAINNLGGIREAPKVGDDGMSIKSSWMHPDGTMEYNYAPHVQVRNCMGVYRDVQTGKLKRAKNWSEFQSKLTKELKPTIFALLKRVDTSNEDVLKKGVESIQELYTTIFLVNEFDKEKALRMTVYSQTMSLTGQTQSIADAIVQSNPMSKPLDSYKIMSNNEHNGMRDILIVFNKDKYKGEINFAYKTIGKILGAGGSLDMSHTIIGTDLTGNPVEINLNNNAYTSLSIIAGSRSGKGVLTLSLLASMLASNCPVVYLDYKPDMAGAFWTLERQVPGSKILAIDGQTNKLHGLAPVRNYAAGHGCPAEAMKELSSEFNVIPYVKGVQLMNLIGMARVAGYLPSGKKMFFILDEAQKCGDKIATDTKSIEAVMNKNKPSGKQPESALHKYLVKLYNMYKSTENAATAFLNTNAGSGNMTAVVLGQQADAAAWTGPFAYLVKKCPIKLLGRETVGGSKYALDPKMEGVGMIDTGYFGLVTSNIPTAGNTTIVKTTMVLNDADFNPDTRTGGEYSGALLKNITNPEIKRDIIDNDMIVSRKNEIALSAGYPEGSANPLVGFPGLIQYIGSMNGNFNLAEALSAGYNEVEKVLTLLGIMGDGAPYSNVEEYMYSGKEDSLFTSNQLANALNYGMTIYDFIEKGIDTNKLNNTKPLPDISSEDDIINMGASDGEPGAAPTQQVVQSPIQNQTQSQQEERMTDEMLIQLVEMLIQQTGLVFAPSVKRVAVRECVNFLRSRGW